MLFSKRLKELRKENNCTQRQLAEILGLTPNSICEWEKARSEPNVETILEIAKFFNTTTDYLLGRTDEFGAVMLTENKAQLSETEHQLITYFRRLPRQMQSYVFGIVQNLAVQA